MSVETRITNLPARLRGVTNKYKYGAGNPMNVVDWLHDEAQYLETAIQQEAYRKLQLELGGE